MRRAAEGRSSGDRRDYAAGDDYRAIDWPVCARRDELLTRLALPHAQPCRYALLDCSRSMALGDLPKIDVARHVAALLVSASLGMAEPLGLTTFGAGLLGDGPPP